MLPLFFPVNLAAMSSKNALAPGRLALKLRPHALPGLFFIGLDPFFMFFR